MKYILTTNNLTKRYGKHYAAEKINIHIKKGEIYGLIGRNGAGKTTILRMISGLSNPTEGTYSVNEKTGVQLRSEKKSIGALIEAPGLYPNMSAYENLKIKCIANGKNDRKYIQELLTLVGLENTGNKKTKEFSLGMRQRLGIALALAGDPELIILDEPINGLDPQGIVEIREILAKLSKEKGITIIISSHILDELSKIADSYGIIHEGKLLEELTAEQLNEKCGEFVILKTDDINKTAKILIDMNITDFVTENNEIIKIHKLNTSTAEIVKQLVTAGVNVNEIYYNRLTLEEYYLNLTGGNNNA
ncbi:MAG: ATP-binding cassette domain-containing protein [Ruminococcus sp.]|nr:ATP-binding cassette domain-containing protein [Ruminococcus sp.]